MALDSTAAQLTQAELASLRGLAQERQAQREGQQDASTEAFMDLMARSCTVFRALPIPAMA